MKGAYLGVYSTHESSRSRVKFVYMCQSQIVKIVNEIK